MRKAQGVPVVEALKEFNKIAGEHSQLGVVVIDKDHSDTIYTSTMGSPLLIGFSPD